MALSEELQREAALEVESIPNGHTLGENDEVPVVQDDAMEITETVDILPSASTLSALPESSSSNDPLQLSADPARPETAEPTLDITDPAPAPAPKKTWQAHDLDIDLVSLKLSKHKYLTPSDFLADISKIEENAEKLGDPDRIAKIGEMGAHARMHVLNFDPAWEPRFEAYAERVRARKAKRQKEKEEKKRLEGVSASAPEVEGEREGSLKRVREDGDEQDEERERGEKRQKEDIEMTTEIVLPTAPVPAPVPTPTSISISEIATVPPPRPDYPPFIVPPHALLNLSNTLTHATSSFNVEQLEQLRAACFDMIWRRRADWDRTTCFSEVGKVIDGLVEEVEEMREDRVDYA
jgi:hypothetical protein